MTWYTYMLRCADNTLYTGVTNNLEKRVRSHNNGIGAKYTAPRTPVELVWHESHDSKSSALKREHDIKKLRREQKDVLIQTFHRLSQ